MTIRSNRTSKMKKNTNFLLLISGLLTATLCLSACINRDDAEFVETTPAIESEQPQKVETKQPTSDINKMQFAEPNVVFKEPEDPSIIRTPEGANELDLETPLRCNVNWKTQQMVLTLPYINSAFKLERNGRNDPLPRFEVTGYTFDMMPAEQALVKLTKEANIRVSSADGPYTSISAEDLKGEFSEVIKMIADSADIYTTYNAKDKILTLSRRVNMTLYTPPSRPIILGLLDVIRGAGITNIVTNWADYSITFDADIETRNKIQELIKSFENSPTLIAYDVSIFRLYPYNSQKDIEWKDLLNAFDFGSITTAQTGVIGRILTTTNDISIEKLQHFLGNQARVETVSEGKFIVPNLWLSRFDIGKCSKPDSNAYGMSILAKASVEKKNEIFSDITLEETNGQVTQFKIRNKLGENFMIIGLPNELFGIQSPKSETIIFMVPRLVRTLRTNENIKNRI